MSYLYIRWYQILSDIFRYYQMIYNIIVSLEFARSPRTGTPRRTISIASASRPEISIDRIDIEKNLTTKTSRNVEKCRNSIEVIELQLVSKTSVEFPWNSMISPPLFSAHRCCCYASYICYIYICIYIHIYIYTHIDMYIYIFIMHTGATDVRFRCRGLASLCSGAAGTPDSPWKTDDDNSCIACMTAAWQLHDSTTNISSWRNSPHITWTPHGHHMPWRNHAESACSWSHQPSSVMPVPKSLSTPEAWTGLLQSKDGKEMSRELKNVKESIRSHWKL
jgi:hypothetical protein